MNQSLKKLIVSALGSEQSMRLAKAYSDLKIRWALATSHVYRQSMNRLESYRNKHVGQRCFIIGNGPSLKQTDLTLLKSEFTFGLNRIYLLFDTMGFTTTYLVCINYLVLEQCADEIAAVKCPKFLGWRVHRRFEFAPDMMFIASRHDPRFVLDLPREGVWEGTTVTYVTMQLAYFMGFKEVILVGVDHSFSTKGPAHKLIVSQSDDPNHFDPKYFGKGFRWQLPNLEMSEVAYSMAKQQFESDGRRILDATIGGKLEVFPKVSYQECF
jgi:hypothetical protein